MAEGESGEVQPKQRSFLDRLFSSEQSNSERSSSGQPAEQTKSRISEKGYKSTKDHAAGGTSWRDSDKEDEVEEQLARNLSGKKSS